jgi:diadenosine tetraphosphate (Ap4A) HIT family hydrolase
MNDDQECAICAMVGGEPVNGWIYADPSWVAGTLAGLEIPGWIVLALRRHAEAPAPLTPREAADMGEAVRVVSNAIVEATGAERVYLQAYGERESHWHVLLSGRGAEIPAEHRHVAFFTHRAKYVDVALAASVADRVRDLVGASPSAQPASQP